MTQFNGWCQTANYQVGQAHIRVLSCVPAQLQFGVDATAAIVPGHYAAEEHVARVLRNLGKVQAADLIIGKLPTTKSIRSGDLGEIYATQWVTEESEGYQVPIKRLRWKDHRNMAMRGDDVIGMAHDPDNAPLRFVKVEAKSRATLAGAVLTLAREGLDKDGGLPSPHALTFISARLVELGNTALADAIDDAQLKTGIQPQQVTHLTFTFSGNEPGGLLQASLQAYAGPFAQLAVGLRVDGHTDFVAAVYDRVIANADND